MSAGLQSRLALAKFTTRTSRHDFPVRTQPTVVPSKVLRWLSIAIGVVACFFIAQAGYIHAKAFLAQHLIASAWRATVATGRPTKPWPWADTYPVARLAAPRLGTDVYVLSGDSGRTLAFGPGHRPGTAAPGSDGNSVISAHRDTHFEFLRDVRAGDVLVVETPDRAVRRYTVVGAEVAHKQEVGFMADHAKAELTLITCYPFGAVNPGGPMRFVVRAVGEPHAASTTRPSPTATRI